MESVLVRYRNLIVLAGVLFAQILGLAVQVKRTTDSESTRLIRIWAVGAVTPFERTSVWMRTSTGNIWHNYFYLRGVRAENRDLRAQIEQMRLEETRMVQDAEQARRLQALLSFKEQFISQTLAAQVIGGSGSDNSRVIYIDKGYSDGIRTDMAVITEDGIVGKVLNADPATGHVARVLLIDDQSSGVGAILEKTRLQGILKGTASGTVQLEKVMSDETVPQDEMVLTSGGDGIFPKGLPIGRVSKVTTGSELFLNIRVRPAANLGKLEEVLVVTKIDERQAQPDQNGSARAVDILAERLPGVPQKPADDKNAAPVAGEANATNPAAAKITDSDAKPKSTLPGQVGANNGAPAVQKPTKPTTPAGSPQVTLNSAAKPPLAAAETTKAPKPVKAATTEPKPAVEEVPH